MTTNNQSLPVDPTAYLSWSLDVDCPHCKESVDLSDNDDENTVFSAIFNNDWGNLKGHEVTCPHCAAEFKISEVEY